MVPRGSPRDLHRVPVRSPWVPRGSQGVPKGSPWGPYRFRMVPTISQWRTHGPHGIPIGPLGLVDSLGFNMVSHGVPVGPFGWPFFFAKSPFCEEACTLFSPVGG